MLSFFISCKDKDRGVPICSSNIFINQGEGTYDVDSVSEKYKKAILETYPGYDFATDCGDSIAAAKLFSLLDASGIFQTGKIISIEILPKMEELEICSPVIYRGVKDSVYLMRDIVDDTSSYCTRKYNYLRLSGEPIHLIWEFAEPKKANIPRYKQLVIYHKSHIGESGSSMIVRVWYRNL